MSAEGTFRIQSHLDAPPAEVWRHISSMRGVNDELAPLLRMTYPAGLEHLDQQEVPLGTRLFRSYVLAFGVLPVDWDDLGFESITSGQGFVERSSLATARAWCHRRWIEPAPEPAATSGGCRLVDHLTWTPRLAVPDAVHRRIVPFLFRHRHQRLTERFGGTTEER